MSKKYFDGHLTTSFSTESFSDKAPRMRIKITKFQRNRVIKSRSNLSKSVSRPFLTCALENTDLNKRSGKSHINFHTIKPQSNHSFDLSNSQSLYDLQGKSITKDLESLHKTVNFQYHERKYVTVMHDCK